MSELELELLLVGSSSIPHIFSLLWRIFSETAWYLALELKSIPPIMIELGTMWDGHGLLQRCCKWTKNIASGIFLKTGFRNAVSI
jgi:hypothetical protein